MIIGRDLKRDEIECVWEIDRAELVRNVYHLEDGELVLKRERWDVAGWPPGEQAIYTPLLIESFNRGGWFHGLFDDLSLVGVVVLDSKFIGPRHDLLQLKFMHVSRHYRQQGLGRRMFDLAAARARQQGARGLYVSATPSENTINFYLRRGCVPTTHPEPDLLALEPEDIHLECTI